jgi:hypothetical protein
MIHAAIRWTAANQSRIAAIPAIPRRDCLTFGGLVCSLMPVNSLVSVKPSRLRCPKPQHDKHQEPECATCEGHLRHNQNQVLRSLRRLEYAEENSQPSDRGRNQQDDQHSPRSLLPFAHADILPVGPTAIGNWDRLTRRYAPIFHEQPAARSFADRDHGVRPEVGREGE